MAIANLQPINIGQPNNPANSDSLYTAFKTIQNNFTTLSTQASNISSVVGGSGIGVSTSNTNVVTVTNTGVTQIQPGNGILINPAGGTGVVSVALDPNALANGNIAAGLSSVGLNSPSNTIAITSTTTNPIAGAGGTGTFRVDLQTIANLTAGTYTNPNVTVDTRGRVTSISSGPTPGTLNRVAFTPGAGIGISGNAPAGGQQDVTITNTGVTSITAGTGISVTQSSGAVTISSTGGGGGSGGGVQSVRITSPTFVITPSGYQFDNADFAITLPNGWSWDSNSNTMTVVNLRTTSNVTVSGSINGTLGASSNAQPNITSLGSLTSLTTVTGGNVSIGGGLTVANNATITGNLGVSVNVTANSFVGNFNGNITGLTATFTGNVSAGNLVATGAVNAATLGGSLTTSAQPNIQSVGTLTSLTVSGVANLQSTLTVNGAATFNNTVSFLSNLFVGGNGTAANSNIMAFSNGAIFANFANFATANLGNLNLANGLSVPNLAVAANATVGGNLVVGSSPYATITNRGNISAQTISAAGNLSFTGNLSGGATSYANISNVLIDAQGNLTVPSYIYANFIQMAVGGRFYGGNVVVDAQSLNVTSNTSTFAGIINVSNANAATSTTTGAVQVAGGVGIGGNLWVAGIINTTSNITGANLQVNGNLTVTGASDLTGGNVDMTNANIAGNANLQGRTTIANLQATVTANADTVSGNLVNVTINGTVYRLLAK